MKRSELEPFSNAGRNVSTPSPREGSAFPEGISRALPGELWGIYSLLSGYAKSYAPKKLYTTSKVSWKHTSKCASDCRLPKDYE